MSNVPLPVAWRYPTDLPDHWDLRYWVDRKSEGFREGEEPLYAAPLCPYVRLKNGLGDAITLPPLPERPWRMFCTKCGRTTPLDAKDVQHSPPGSPFVSQFGVCPCGYQALAEQAPWTADQLRARDTEVARLVVEAAASRAATEDVAETDDPMGVQQCIVFGIRVLEVRHHE